MADYVPQNDAEFNLWQAGLVEITESKLIDWGIPEADLTSLKSTQSSWTIAFSKASNKQNRTSADVKAKNDARTAYEKQLRGFVAQWLTNNANVPDSERERMGLNVKSETRTATPIPETCPIGRVDFSIRRQHTIHFADETTPTSRAKPAGVHGCQIWMKIDGDPPVSVSELTFVATDTRTPYTQKFEGQYVGKEVYYWLRWVNTRGEPGPWSSTISAIVAG